MHKTLQTIQDKLESLIHQVDSAVPSNDPIGVAQNNWSFACLSKDELINKAQNISDLIQDRGTDQLGSYETLLSDYPRRLDHLLNQTAANLWGNGNHAIPAYLHTLNGLQEALEPALEKEDVSIIQARHKTALKSLRSIESKLKKLEPRTGSLTDMVSGIEQAHSAAEQLPTDLETLSETREEIEDIAQVAEKNGRAIEGLKEDIESIHTSIDGYAVQAKAVLEQCETAYSAATSIGLAAAFSERSDTLSRSMWVWVCGLVLALAAGSYFGSSQVSHLVEMTSEPDTPAGAFVFNIALSVLSIGAPVWFAWLATKQIGQRFRLAEDYAFKASVSRAYEGFRRETARFDKDMEARLLTTALNRLDELPLRLVETESHGSPWHELISSDSVQKALTTVPGFPKKVQELANRSVSKTSPRQQVANTSESEEQSAEKRESDVA
ncbi:hypothetical protein [Aestuariispira insulae]|uniref:Uncharacterized protein n=1 Tax=Aestuariispira insulae TaxID=1461337 RepID=A0A3D9H4K2_9PROT|nr:hypothetical protein [Aestuariispira insulae]RED44101.1 hypothetical protein DFP90_1174 [Aestuariispira insulae]